MTIIPSFFFFKKKGRVRFSKCYHSFHIYCTLQDDYKVVGSYLTLKSDGLFQASQLQVLELRPILVVFPM